MAEVSEWLEAHLTVIQWLGSCSVALLVVTVVAVPVVVMRLPANYFSTHHREPARTSGRFNILYMGVILVKNLIGWVIILAGVALLFLPGQGVITILIGFALTNFPGKFAIERWFVRQRGVSGSLNWIRARVGKPPFVMPPETTKEGQHKIVISD